VSAEPENEVLDLQQVTEVDPPAKVTPAAKKASPNKPKSRDEIKAELRADFEAQQSNQDELERMREEIRAELRAEYEAKLAQAAPVADASFEGMTETPYLHVVPGPGEIVIHMVDDGLTYGPKVYTRGEEIALNPEENPWANYSRAQQIQFYGKQVFAKGPWPYGGYDLTDPALSAEDKKRLIQATRSESYS